MEPATAEKLSAAGITLWQVGYHRGSDGMLFAMGRERRDLEMSRLVGLLLEGRDDDDDALIDSAMTRSTPCCAC